MLMLPPVALLGVMLALLTAVAIAAAKALVVAQPDEWLLCIRNGRLVRAGVGISLWRRPGDVVARFTSTVQRVGFAVDALSRERLPVTIEGFILWSVSQQGEDPFTAFQKLGLVNLNARPAELRSPKHLLATPQHRAFQQLLGAAVQRLSSTMSLDQLLLQQDALVAALGEHLGGLRQQMGIRVEQIQILQVRPSDTDLLRQLSAEVEERVREEATNIHLEAEERAQRRAIDSETRLAQEKAAARRQEMDRDKALRLAQIEHEREVQLRNEEVALEQALAAEARTLEIARAVLSRDEVEFEARLDRIRREADANRDAMTALTTAEEQKTQGVRDHEIARLVAEKVGDALKTLPLHEARWITVGKDSPASSFAGLIGAAHELVSSGTSRGARPPEGG